MLDVEQCKFSITLSRPRLCRTLRSKRRLPSFPRKRVIRIMARKDVVGGIISACGEMFPEMKDKMQKPHAAWVQAQKPDLEKAAIVIVTYTSRKDAKLTSKLLGEEHQKLRKWAENDLGIRSDARPTADDCLKLADKLDTLPAYPQP